MAVTAEWTRLPQSGAEYVQLVSELSRVARGGGGHADRIICLERLTAIRTGMKPPTEGANASVRDSCWHPQRAELTYFSTTPVELTASEHQELEQLFGQKAVTLMLNLLDEEGCSGCVNPRRPLGTAPCGLKAAAMSYLLAEGAISQELTVWAPLWSAIAEGRAGALRYLPWVLGRLSVLHPWWRDNLGDMLFDNSYMPMTAESINLARTCLAAALEDWRLRERNGDNGSLPFVSVLSQLWEVSDERTRVAALSLGARVCSADRLGALLSQLGEAITRDMSLAEVYREYR